MGKARGIAALLFAITLPFVSSPWALAGNAGWQQSLTGFLKGQSQTAQAKGPADGSGVWMNIWNYPTADLEPYLQSLESNGIRNLFVQTSRSNTPAIVNPQGLAALIDGCHRHHIRLIAWSFAELENPQVDADKLTTAATFESSTHQRVDGVAADLEGNLQAARVETYAKMVRGKLGQTYPLMAIVFSPLNRALGAQLTPWKTIADNFDVIAPMTYWAGKKHKFSDAYNYTYTTVQQIRYLTGRSDVEIHVIGDGMYSTLAELEQFLRGCQAAEVTSASLYPNAKPTYSQLACLSHYEEHFPPNARFRIAAFRQLRKDARIAEPPKHDPAAAISRGEFYRLLVSELLPGWTDNAKGANKQTQPQVVPMTQMEAMQQLINLGLISQIPDNVSIFDVLAQPIYPKEALAAIAGVIEAQNEPKAATGANSAHLPKDKMQTASAPRRPGHWFIQPAYAESQNAAKGADSRAVNFVDASQMVLQARAGLK